VIGWLLGKLFGFYVKDVRRLDPDKPLLVVVRGGDDEDVARFSAELGRHVSDVIVVVSDSFDVQLMRLG